MENASARAMGDAGASSSPTSPAMRRRPSYRALRSLSPRSGGTAFSCGPPCQEEEEGHGHFLDACHLCGRPLGRSRDIFMYRGDTPFCSEECRQEQIEFDEAQEEEEEEETSYRRSGRRRAQCSGHRAGGSAAAPAGRAAETAVAV